MVEIRISNNFFSYFDKSLIIYIKTLLLWQKIVMLRIADILNNKEKVISGLVKKRFQDAEKNIDLLIKLDNDRKSKQTELDETLKSINSISKEIGMLMKEGKKDEAEKVKQKIVGTTM